MLHGSSNGNCQLNSNDTPMYRNEDGSQSRGYLNPSAQVEKMLAVPVAC